MNRFIRGSYQETKDKPFDVVWFADLKKRMHQEKFFITEVIYVVKVKVDAF